MADQRCPMCGKLNPAELEICQFCQARLKPLISSGAGAADNRQEIPDNELPEWLRALRQKNAGENRAADEPLGGRKTGEEDALPDWLRGDTPAEGGSENKAPAPGISDWLTGLRNDSPQADLPEAEADPEPDEGDWWQRAGGSGPVSRGEDWLNSFGREEAGAADQETGAMPGEAGQGEAEMAEDTPAAPASNVPDWLSQFQDPKIEPAFDAGEIPDWMAQFGAEPAGREPPSASQMPPFAGDDFQSGDLTGGLAGGLGSWFAQEEPAGAGGQDLPDWMAGLTAESPDEPLEEEAETFEPEKARDQELLRGQELPPEIVPDWLKDLEEDQIVAETAGAEAASAEAASAEPPVAEEPQAPSEETGWEAAVPTPSEELPDWMGAFANSAPPPVEDTAAAGDLTPTGDIEDDLAWLHALESQSPPLPSEASAVAAFAKRVDPFFTDEENQQELEPLFDAEIPDWLSQISPETPAEGSGPTAEEASLQASLQSDPSTADPSLEPADLPVWLEAMRPAGPPPPETGEAESAGPLSGLHDVLKAEPEITRVSKPQGLSLKLDVTPAQQAHADLLLKMIQAEGEPRPLPARPVVTSQNVLRIVMALVLMAAIIWPLMTGTPAVSLPAFQAGMAPVVEQINNLQVGAPVLVAVDYEPGLAGELDPLASSLVHHLILKGAHLTLVSTTPNGPAQAERLVSLAYSRLNPEGQLEAERYANLGYIPGGAAGLRSFAENPAALLPLTVQGDPAWQVGPLSGKTGVNDFALLLVITQDPDDARGWIEQVQPRLAGTPLLMATSAQAAPLVLPYWTTGASQVQGLVSGLAGGASYDQLLGRTNEAQAYWPAYSMGLLAAAGLIFIGGLYNLVSAGVSRRRPPAATPAGRRAARKPNDGKKTAPSKAASEPVAEPPTVGDPPDAGEAEPLQDGNALMEALEPSRAKQKKAKGTRKP